MAHQPTHCEVADRRAGVFLRGLALFCPENDGNRSGLPARKHRLWTAVKDERGAEAMNWNPQPQLLQWVYAVPAMTCLDELADVIITAAVEMGIFSADQARSHIQRRLGSRPTVRTASRPPADRSRAAWYCAATISCLLACERRILLPSYSCPDEFPAAVFAGVPAPLFAHGLHQY